MAETSNQWPSPYAIVVYPDGKIVLVPLGEAPKPLVFPDRPVFPTKPAVFDDSELVQYMDKCGCRVGTVCLNVACPHLVKVTC